MVRDDVDDHLQAALFGRMRVFVQALGRAVRRDHFGFVRNAELLQRFGGMTHRLPVGAAAHDDADEW